MDRCPLSRGKWSISLACEIGDYLISRSLPISNRPPADISSSEGSRCNWCLFFFSQAVCYVVTNICGFKNPILSTEWFGILCTTAGSTTWKRFCMQPSPSAIGTSLNCGAVWLSGFWVDKSNELRDKSCLGRTKVSMRCETKGAIIISIYQTRPRLTNWPHISGDLWNSPKCFIAPPLFLI